MNRHYSRKESWLLFRPLFAGLILTLAIISQSTWTHAQDAVEPTGLRLVVIGATARSANELLPQALAAGHEVIGITRRPEAVEFHHERLTILKGDVRDQASIEAALTGNEFVVSLIGWVVQRDEDAPDQLGLFLNMEIMEDIDLYSVGSTNIIQAMKNKGNKRLLFTTSGGVNVTAPATKPDSPTDEVDPAFWRRQMYFWNVRRLYDDFRRAEVILHNSELDYTILRPAQLMPVPARGNLKVATDLNYPQFTAITYADFAAFILEQLESDEFIGKATALYSDEEF